MLGFAASVTRVVDPLIHGHLILCSVVNIYIHEELSGRDVCELKLKICFSRSLHHSGHKNNRIYLKQGKCRKSTLIVFNADSTHNVSTATSLTAKL